MKNVTIDYLMNKGERIKREFSDFLRNNLGGIGIVESIVFGDKSNLTKEEYEKFQKMEWHLYWQLQGCIWVLCTPF